MPACSRVPYRLLVIGYPLGTEFTYFYARLPNFSPLPVRVSFFTFKVITISSKEEFMDKIGECDSYFEDKRVEAEKKGSLLKYGVEIDPKKGIKVKLKEYSLDHPFSSMKDSDNIILFKTKRYNERPLVIQGPGAGPQVTAAGIFSDLIRLANVLGKDQ